MALRYLYVTTPHFKTTSVSLVNQSSSFVTIFATNSLGAIALSEQVFKFYIEILERGTAGTFNMEQFGIEALSSLIRNTTMEWQERLQVYIFLYQAIIPPDHLLPIGTSAYHFFAS